MCVCSLVSYPGMLRVTQVSAFIHVPKKEQFLMGSFLTGSLSQVLAKIIVTKSRKKGLSYKILHTTHVETTP